MILKAWEWFAGHHSELEVICLFLSAVAAFWLVTRSNRISRREKTIEMIKDSLDGSVGAGTYAEYRTVVKDIEAGPNDIGYYSSWDKDEDENIYQVLNRQLNYYELVSLGIRKGVFDEKFYKSWFRSQVMRDHARLLPYIEGVRKRRGPEFFSEFRWLVTRWERKEHPDASPRLYKLVWWLLCGKRQRVAAILQRQVAKNAAKRALARMAKETED